MRKSDPNPLRGLGSVASANPDTPFSGTWRAVSSHLRDDRGFIATANGGCLATVSRLKRKQFGSKEGRQIDLFRILELRRTLRIEPQ
jgi:hypothetical protein